MSTISAGTTTTTGYVVTSDTTGALVLKTGASGTTAVTVGSDQSVTFAGSQTFSGGTANGVLYLNGSKVATSGSALTFDGTTLGNSTSGTPLSLNRTGAGTALIELKQSGTVGSYLGTSGASDMIFFNGSAAELMRLNGTGLGIGTSSPSQKLSLQGSSTTYALAETTGTGTSSGFRMKAGASADYTLFTTQGVNQFAIYDNVAGAERLTLSSSGNLGLGTASPSAKLDLVKAGGLAFRTYYGSGNNTSLDVNVDTSNGDARLTWNTTNSSGTYTYFQSNKAAMLQGGDGFRFYIAPTGTAGNAITFTQAMALNDSGRLGVGTTAPNKLVTINSATNDVEVLRINLPGASGGVQAKGDIGFGFYDTSDEASAAIGFEEFGTSSAGGSLLFKTRPDGAAVSTRPTERMRITQGGNVGIGTSSPAQKLDVSSGDSVTRIAVTNTANAANGSGLQFLVLNGGTESSNVTIRADNADNIQFFNKGGERARITSDGKLLVGTTGNSGSQVRVISGSNNWAFQSNDIYRVFNKNAAFGSTSTTRTCSIDFASQGSNWSGHLVEVIFAGAYDVSGTVIAGKATFAVVTLTVLGVNEIEDIGQAVSFSAAASGTTLVVTATTTTLTNWTGWTVRVTSTNSFSAPTSISIA